MKQRAPKQQEEEKERSNVLELITGGKGPHDPENWVGELPPGAHFLFKRKTRANQGMNVQAEDVGVQRAVVVHQFETCTLLFDNLNQPLYFIVESIPFSRMMRMVQLIHQEQQPEELATEILPDEQQQPS